MGPDRFCDLVMKGGITSGIVYPQAVLELSRRYRFKNIGGTSAGAIAAAVVAAAALGERRRMAGSVAAADALVGMAGLAEVAKHLATAGSIAALFQPVSSARAPYRLLTRWFAVGRAGKLLETALAVVRLAWLPALLVWASIEGLAFWIAGGAGVVAATLPAVGCAAVAGAVAAVLRTGRVLSGNMLGLCPGLRQGDGAPEALTEWMHRVIRQLAGTKQDEVSPVTFGDLWNAPAYADEPAGDRRLNLQIVTTDVSHSTPRTLPLAHGGLFFREDEFRRLFPAPVVDWLVAHAPSTRVSSGVSHHELPDAERFPIVVAARMSLSFPLLISAVPLHEVDYASASEDGSRVAAGDGTVRRVRLSEEMEELASTIVPDAAPAEARPLRRCWFTDRGVSSNFPIHLFDAPLPRWPTFAIDLLYPGQDVVPEPVFLPSNNNQGLRPGYRPITGRGGISDVAELLLGIVHTMQNWRDLLQGRAPGHRDRIVRIALQDEEGGMNILMPQHVLTAVADKGARAGRLLAAEFDFGNHYWVRHRSAASAIERFVVSYAKGAAAPASPDAAEAFRRAWDPRRGTAGPYRFTAAQSEESVRRLTLLKAQGDAWATADGNLTKGAPRPLPELRMAPTY